MTGDLNLEPFIEQMQGNCDISDASGSNVFSICGMALRLRDLNKWEKGLKPWEENDPKDVLAWIDQKEQVWEKAQDLDFKPLDLEGRRFDPFDTRGINRVLARADLFYGAGYGHSLKPVFFLARIEEGRNTGDTPLIILGRELVRDLLTLPALTQDDAVVIRREAAGLFLWDQMAYLKKSGQRFLRFGLRACGLPDPGVKSRKTHFNAILGAQEQTYIHHEIGEIKDRVFDRRDFRKILSQFAGTSVEFLARTIKDLLADTGPRGTLNQIITTQNAAGLGFYAAFQDGLFRPLFPGLRPAVERFVSDGDWERIEETRLKGFETACQSARDLRAMFKENEDQDNIKPLEEKIHQALVQPLLK